uniref:Hypothetical chloroplast RF47 n=1 Tax=Edaphochlorella mirabilis TaxID=3083 RepID=A0A097KKS6_9CHLO|nr:hypothetical chloroplast RF47 [Edaphochlorella mirabilis]AIT93794.1 hypothetical chloroplast RF47 [Edaphochlorella mirabilis]
MINLIRVILALFVIILIVPQTPTENALLRTFLDTRVFANYGQAKSFLNFLTWSCIFIFLGITFMTALK